MQITPFVSGHWL